MTLAWQTAHIPFGVGLNTGSDSRALAPPDLAVCRDAEFDEEGGLQTRKPYTELPSEIVDGGSVANARKLVAFGDELLLFTSEALYSWSDRDQAWVLKGTHLAAKLTERSRFVNTTEQVSCDRAELSGCVFFTWVEATTGSTGAVKVGVMDKETGAVLLAPTTIGTGSRPRLQATTNRVVLFYRDETLGDLSAVALSPGSLASSAAVTPTVIYAVADGFSSYYDVVASGTTLYVVARRNPTTEYEIMTVTEALVPTRTTKTPNCDGPIAIALAPNGTHIQVIRANGVNIQGDYLTISGPFTTVTADQAVGTRGGAVCNQLAAAYRSVANSGQYRCYAFWSTDEAADSSDWVSKYNYVDTGGGLGTQANFVRRLGIASRAFDHNGRVFVWTAFASESTFGGSGSPGFRAAVQNTYFLYRDDAFLVAKAAPGRAAGFRSPTGNLPSVQSLGSNVYAWCGAERRVVPTSAKQTAYSDRAPREVLIEFDADEARRCVRLGDTLYITGGEILQYDGVGLYEVGFHVYPWYFAATSGAGGSVAPGDYALKWTSRFDNARGERERSTTATVGTVSVAGDEINILVLIPLHTTHKTSFPLEYWRSTIDPTADAPMYLGTSQDPTATTGSNKHVVNDLTSSAVSGGFDDGMSDATISTKESNNENGGVLENLSPPAASVIAASNDRVFLAGISDDPHSVWYSKLRSTGEIAAFHDVLVVTLPPTGGDITALAFLNETLVVFKERAIYALPGDGFDNAGGGQNYGPPRLISSDVGADSAEAVCTTPRGIMFHSQKGWYLLGQGFAVDYIGRRVSEWDSEEVVACTLLESKHQIRCATASRVLTYDYVQNQWAEWTISGVVDAVVWNGTYSYLGAANTVFAESSDYTGIAHGLDVETAWIKLGDPQGQAKLRWIAPLGEFRGSHRLLIRIARNYQESDADGPTWFDEKVWTASPAVVGGPLDLRHGPSIRDCKAFKVRITALEAEPDSPDDITTPPSTEALKLTGLSVMYGVRPGLYRRNPAAQTQ